MNQIARLIYAPWWVTSTICLVIGFSMAHGYAYIRFWVSPVFIKFVNETAAGAELSSLQLLFLNIVHAGISGLIVAIITLALVQYLFKPTTLLWPQVISMPYIFLGFWWYIDNYSINNNENHGVALVSQLIVIIVWFLCSWWLVSKNSPNKSLKNGTREKLRAP